MARATAIEEIPKIVAKARQAFASQKTKDVKFRREQLQALMKMMNEQEDLMAASVKKDFGKPYFETILTETEFVKNCIRHSLIDIENWMKPEPIPKNLVTIRDKSFLVPEPYGTVLIIAPWNYPINLLLSPLVGAIAAGCTAVVKPSELTPSVANFFADLLPRYLDTECYQVISGGVEETQALLQERFDYIFYTGSTNVGRLVYQAAAKHLTPVTLELGGKSPCYLDDSVPDMEVAVRRILWGKCINSGQTCVAPDYLLCTPDVQKKVVTFAKQVITQFYGEDPKKSPDYNKVVNETHFQRLEKLLAETKGNVSVGGQMDIANRFIEPTIVTNVSPDDSLMSQEIFGPILPIVTVSGPQEAVDFINKREKPLSLYLFTVDQKVTDKFLAETSSGSVCGNDTVIHLCVDGLPFGGVGHSGLGAYHGKFSFDTFSHRKPVIIRTYDPILEAIAAPRYPPYNDTNLTFLNSIFYKTKGIIPHNVGLISTTILATLMGIFTAWFRKITRM